MLRLFDAAFYKRAVRDGGLYIYIYTIYILLGYEALGCVYFGFPVFG